MDNFDSPVIDKLIDDIAYAGRTGSLRQLQELSNKLERMYKNGEVAYIIYEGQKNMIRVHEQRIMRG